MKNKTISGISPITNKPFSEKDLEAYGHIKNEDELFEKYNKLDIFDYDSIKKDFIAFKKENPLHSEIPSSVIEKREFKALAESNKQMQPKF